MYSRRSHHQLSVDVWIFKIRSQIRILQAFLCQKTVKNEAQKAKETNRTPTIIWEVRVQTQCVVQLKQNRQCCTQDGNKADVSITN